MKNVYRNRQVMAQTLKNDTLLDQSFFIYSLKFSAIASAVSSTQSVNIQADSDFMVQAMSASVFDNVTNAQIASPNGLIQLTDTGSGTNLNDIFIPIVNFFGTAQLPFTLPVPRLMAANSLLTAAFTNGVTTNAVNVYLSFIGKKLFRSN